MAAGRNAIAVPAGVTPELPHFTHRLVHPRLRMNSCRGCSATVAGRRLGRRKGPREASRFTEERDRGESRPEGASRRSGLRHAFGAEQAGTAREHPRLI